MSEETKSSSTHYSSTEARQAAVENIADLVTIASDDSPRDQRGRFISDHQVQLIEAHQDQIRDNSKELAVMAELAKGQEELKRDFENKLEEQKQFYENKLKELKRELENKSGKAGTNDSEAVNPNAKDLGTTKPEASKEKEPGNELRPGDQVRYKDREGSVIEGIIESTSELDNEDYVFYNVRTASGELKTISYADLRKIEQEKDVEPFKVSKELEGKIFEAASLYARETAKTRKTYWGYLLKTSKRWVKIPGVKRLADKIGDKVDDNIEIARKEYEQSIEKQLYEEIDKYFEKIYTKEETETKEIAEVIKRQKFAYLKFASVGLEALIQQKSSEISGQAGKFTEFFVNRKGVKGRIQRYAAMALIGGAAGGVALLTGLAVPGVLAAGGLAGLASARSITNRRANAIVDKDGLKTVADVREEEDVAKISSILSSPGQTLEEATKAAFGVTSGRTSSVTRENRELTNSSIIAGKAGAAAVVGAAHVASGLVGGGSPADTGTVPKDPPLGTETAGGAFDIQSGSSFTRELMDQVISTGHSLSPNQALELHNELMVRFGNYILDPSTGNSVGTYLRAAGDTGISAPGTGQWAPGVESYVNSWLTARGL